MSEALVDLLGRLGCRAGGRGTRRSRRARRQRRVAVWRASVCLAEVDQEVSALLNESGVLSPSARRPPVLLDAAHLLFHLKETLLLVLLDDIKPPRASLEGSLHLLHLLVPDEMGEVQRGRGTDKSRRHL